MSIGAEEFEALRPRFQLLVERLQDCPTDSERARMMSRLEELFLAAAWNLATDLLDNGWAPMREAPRRETSEPQPTSTPHLRLVVG